MGFAAGAPMVPEIPKWIILISGCVGSAAIAVRAFLSHPGAQADDENPETTSVSQDATLTLTKQPDARQEQITV